MAKKLVEVDVCDACGTEHDVKPVTLELCADDEARVREMLAPETEKARPKRAEHPTFKVEPFQFRQPRSG